MKMSKNTALINNMSRVFYRTDACNKYNYGNCFAIDELSQARSEPTKVQCPDGRGGFQTIGFIPGELGNVTTTIRNYDQLHYENELDIMFRNNCVQEFQVHFGQCERPNNFNEFDKIIAFENVFTTNFSKSQLVALNSSELAVITTSLGLFAESFYTILPMSYSTNIRENDTLGPWVSVASQCSDTCPECLCSVIGQDIVLALQIRNDPENMNEACLFLQYSFDGGVTFTAVELPCFGIAHAVDPVTCDGIVFYEAPNIRIEGDYAIISVSPGQSYVISIRDLFETGTITPISYSGRLGTFDFAVYDSVVCDGYTYIVGQAGNFYRISNDSGYVSKIDLNTTNDLYSVSCNGNSWLVGGEDGVWYGSGIFGTFSTGSPADALNVNINDNRYLAANRRAVFTSCDCTTWNQVWAAPSTHCIKDIQFYNNNIGYMILNNNKTAANQYPLIYRTVDGGITWHRISNVVLPENYILMELSACSVNEFYAVGYEETGVVTQTDYCNPDEAWISDLNGGIYEAILIHGEVA